MNAISLLLQQLLSWSWCRRTNVGQLLIAVLAAMSLCACASTSYVVNQPCDLPQEHRGYPSCLRPSGSLETSFDAEIRSRPRRDAHLMGQAVGGGSGPSGYSLNGKPGEQWWGFHMGNSAHKAIAEYYAATHPGVVYKNTTDIKRIVADVSGDTSALQPDELLLRPDITDMSARVVFQIKSNADGELQKGQARVAVELAVLNRSGIQGNPFRPGTGFGGELGIRFADDVSPWRLTWQTTAPGVVQYRWTKLNPKDQSYDAYREAYENGQWVDLSAGEMAQYAEALSKAVDMLVSNRELVRKTQAVANVPIHVVGIGATSVLTAELSRLLTSFLENAMPAGRSPKVTITFTRPRPQAAAPTVQTPAPSPGMTPRQPAPPPPRHAPPPPH